MITLVNDNHSYLDSLCLRSRDLDLDSDLDLDRRLLLLQNNAMLFHLFRLEPEPQKIVVPARTGGDRKGHKPSNKGAKMLSVLNLFNGNLLRLK